MKQSTMKNICIVDPLSPRGHRDVNRVIIDITKSIGNLTVICSESLVDKKYDSIEYIQYDDALFEISPNSLNNRRRLFSVFKKLCQEIENRNFDLILFTSYEIVISYMAINIFRLLSKKTLKKVCMLNHSNVDDMDRSKIKSQLFKWFDNDITFLCYDEYVGEYIGEKYKKRWSIIRHNLNDYKKKYRVDNVCKKIKTFFEDSNTFKVIIPGELAFREDILKQLIELDRSKFLLQKRIKVFIKDKNTKYVSKSIMVLNEYMNDDEYSYVFSMCDCVTIIYDPNIYVYRSSGIFFDSITFGKPMIYCKNKFFDDKEKKFGILGIEFNGNFKSTFEKIAFFPKDKIMTSLSDAYDYYSNEKIRDDIRHLILGVDE